MDAFVKKHCKNNPDENEKQLRKRLKEAVKDKKNGATCNICSNEIWAIDSAVVYRSGFTCLTGEADASEDDGIDEVCW